MNKYKYGAAFCALAVGTVLMASSAQAKVSPAEAEKLKTTLTPLGAERAGNADGSIPAWTGGLHGGTLKTIDNFTDPFASEKPLFSITAKNMSQYADKLSDGVKALFAKYPDTYRIDVYPTHRTLANPQFVYDNTFKNATNAELINLIPTKSWGGIPFPIPKDAAEIMWNNNLKYVMPNSIHDARGYLVTSNGTSVMTTNSLISYSFPYFSEGEGEGSKDKSYWLFRFDQQAPPIRAGESILIHYAYDYNDEASWVYLTGQRRVRKLPNACCDTPFPPAAGVLTFDDVYVWTGRLDRYDWTLVGKKEMYIPANSNRSVTLASDADFIGPHHVNPDALRYELHRVWVVDANLAAGKRHTAPRARFYIDEDSWMAVLGDRWVSDNQLWKTTWNTPVVIPEVPTTFAMNFGFVDMTSGTQYYAALYNNSKQKKIEFVDKWPTGEFTADALAGEGVR